MKYVEVVAESNSIDTISAIGEKAKAHDIRHGSIGQDGMQPTRLLISDDKLQSVLDALQNILGAQPTARTTVLAVETSLPVPEDGQRDQEDAAIASRESLYEGVEKSAQLNLNYLVLVGLSTLVAAIGLIENNIAVVIGAMLIAPLLGPNLALSLGTALGDLRLVRKSASALLAGIVLALAVSAGLGFWWHLEKTGPELISRTQFGLETVALALAAGAAAALSLTTGLSATLVGVMVAVALLPPIAVMGIMLGRGHPGPALNAGILLAINVVCVNLASNLVFALKGIRPRRWLEREKARRATLIYILAWLIALIVLILAVYARQSLSV